MQFSISKLDLKRYAKYAIKKLAGQMALDVHIVYTHANATVA